MLSELVSATAGLELPATHQESEDDIPVGEATRLSLPSANRILHSS